jgi:hypothetical protein
MSVVPAAHGYRVDPALGIVYGRRGRIIRGSLDRVGYVQFVHVTKGERVWPLAHRLIWEAVHGPVPDGFELNHRNGRKTDNRIENLEVVTRGDNLRHAYRLGLRTSTKGRRRTCRS